MALSRTGAAAAALLAALPLAALPLTAWAAGFALKEQSAAYQGAAFAGAAARADDPATLFFNPAGMAALPGTQFGFDFAGILPQARASGERASLNSPAGRLPVAGGDGSNVAGDVLLPSFYATTQLAPDWHLGLAVLSPYGLATKYDAGSVARYHALTSDLTVIEVLPALAWRALPWLSLGLGLQIDSADAHLSNAVDFGSLGAARGLPGARPGGLDGVSRVKGGDTALGWQAGLLLEPAAGTRIGLNYRSAVFHRLTGSIGFQGAPAPFTAAFAAGRASAGLVTPEQAAVALAQRIGAVTLLAELDFTRWSRFRSLAVAYPGGSAITEERWRDSFTVSLGADWRVAERLTLRGGLAFDQSPVPDATRTPRIPDGDRTWLSVGASWRVLPGLAIAAAYSHIFVASTRVALADLGPGTPNFGRGNLTAKYRGQIDIVSLGGTVSF